MKAAGDEVFYALAMARILRWAGWLAAAGSVAALALYGWREAAGFLAGGLASCLNFRWLKQLADGLGPASGPPRKRLVVLLATRYLLFGAAGYVIVKFLGASVRAAAAGLLVAVAAVLIEMLYELIHA